MKQIKTVGLTIAMVLALTALLGATSASASQFRAEEYPTSLTGAQSGTHKFTLSKLLSLSCDTATLSGAVSEASSAVTLTPAYSQCKTLYGPSTVVVNSCKYVFHSTNEAAPYTGTMDIACSKEGDAIEVNTPGGACLIKYPAQASRGTVEFANTGKKSRSRTITATLKVTGLKFTESGIFCQESGTHETGTYTGTSVIKGLNEKAGHAVGVYLANEQVESLPMFEGEEYPLVTQEEQTGTPFHVSLNGGSIAFECATMNGTSTTSTKFGASTTEFTQSVQNWKGCHLGGEFNVSMNGCYFTLHVLTSETPAADGSLGVGCPKGAEIRFKVPLYECEVKIPAQSGLSSLHFENTGTGASRAITVKVGATGMKYTETGSFCPKSGGTYENGILSGNWTLRGYHVAGEQTVEGEHLLIPGAQKGIWIE